MSERIVNIHADGKLVYTGYLSRAAERTNLSVAALIACINKRRNLREHQPRRTFVNADGKVKPLPKATEYVASFGFPQGIEMQQAAE